MHAGTVPGPDGSPILRLWEWERTRDLVYQVDFWLPPGSAFLFVGVRIRNPWPHAVPAYWWSNIAVASSAGTRVVGDVPKCPKMSHYWDIHPTPAPPNRRNKQTNGRLWPTIGPRVLTFAPFASSRFVK